MPSVQWSQGLADRERLGSLHGLRLSLFRDSGDDFREHSQVVDAVVPGHLVADVSQDGGQRFGVAGGFLVWGATRPRGRGCTSCAAQWCGQDEIDYLDEWRLTRPT